MSIQQVSKTGNGDEYFTPRYVVEILLSYLKETSIKTIWCPCDKKDSEFVKVFEENGYKVIYSHIHNGQDFLTYKPIEEYDIIITNPPFSIKNKIIERCLELNKPFVLLLSATVIQSASLIKLLERTPELFFIMFDKRISYSGDRPPFPSWYFTSRILKENKFYIYQQDPRTLLSPEITLSNK